MIDPFTLIHEALWALIDADAQLTDMVRSGNRVTYLASRNPEKDTLATADLPELRLIPMGGSANIHRTTSSVSCVRQWAFQLHSGDQRLNVALFPIEWRLLCALSGWRQKINSLLWEGERFVARVGPLTISEEMLRPVPGAGEASLKGWVTVWTGEVECFFANSRMRVE